ncbi:MAG: hypothetical protein WCV82_04145 [Candidatus Paceibacterota bacterium]
MKKALFLVGVIFSLMVASCTSFSLFIRPPVFVAVSESPRSSSNLVTISVQPSWENDGPGNSHGNNGQGQKRVSSFTVTIRNNTGSTIRILWNKSALKYNGGSFAPFIDGHDYGNSPSSMNYMILSPHGSARKTIYSTQQRYIDKGKHDEWKMRPIEADHVVLVFCVQSYDNMEEYYTITM